MSPSRILASPLMVVLRNNPDMMKLFTKNNWIRICHHCGEFVGNTALWIEHCLKSRRHIKNVSVKKKRYSMEPIVEVSSDSQIVDEIGTDEVDEDVIVPDWLYMSEEESRWDEVD